MLSAVIALCVRRSDRLDLSQKARGAALYEWHASHHAHSIHPPPRVQVIKCAQYHIKGSIICGIKLMGLDVCMMCHNSYIGIECGCCVARHYGLGLVDVFFVKKKLPVQVRKLNGI